METAKYTLTCTTLPLAPMLEHVVQNLKHCADEKAITLHIEGDTALMVYADEVRIIEVLSNLVSNAIKYTPEAGCITVRTALDKKHAGFAEVSVEDNGCGIGDDHKARIFDRLFQVDSSSLYSERGLGLGLHICQQIIERHHGSISVDSCLGKGSTFRFTLPMKEGSDE